MEAGLDLQTAVSLLRSYADPASQHALRTTEVREEDAQAWCEVLQRATADAARGIAGQLDEGWRTSRVLSCPPTSS